MQKVTIVRHGYFHPSSDRVRLPVAALKVGMYVLELDKPWTDTPFLFQGFRIESVSQIEEIAQYCEWVEVEYKTEHWVGATERAVLNKPTRRRTYTAHTLNQRVFDDASRVHEEARSVSRSMMDDVRLGRAINVKEVQTTVSSAVRSVLESPDTMIWLSRIRSRDEYTSEHCVNVGLLGINFGRHLGYSEEDLNRIGFAAMLHDVGKMLTPLEVLNKEGALTQEEFQLMMDHTTHGRNILMAHQDVWHGAVDVAYGHHEALDGTGYPRKLQAGGIAELTRIVTLCDVYDAITSDRCYRKGQSSLKALDAISHQRGKKYDDRLSEEFLRCIGLYPTGSVVELKSGEHGIVLSSNYRYRHLPRVLLVRDQNHQQCEESVLDLQKLSGRESGENQLIRTVVPNGTHGIRVEEYVRRGLQIL